MPDLSYNLTHEAGDEVIINDCFYIILDTDQESNEYYMAWKGKFRWKDAQEIDAIAEIRTQSNKGI